jgi:hypothetical protein
VTKKLPPLPPLPEFTLEQKLWFRLGTLETLYVDTKNPFFVWVAWEIISKHKFEIPEWVLEYFDQCATNLLAVADTDAPKDANAVTRAIGFKCEKGAGSFQDASLILKELTLGGSAGKRVSGGEYETYVYEYLSKELKEQLQHDPKERLGVSSSSIRLAYKKLQDDFIKDMEKARQNKKNKT